MKILDKIKHFFTVKSTYKEICDCIDRTALFDIVSDEYKDSVKEYHKKRLGK